MFGFNSLYIQILKGFEAIIFMISLLVLSMCFIFSTVAKLFSARSKRAMKYYLFLMPLTFLIKRISAAIFNSIELEYLAYKNMNLYAYIKIILFIVTQNSYSIDVVLIIRTISTNEQESEEPTHEVLKSIIDGMIDT